MRLNELPTITGWAGQVRRMSSADNTNAMRQRATFYYGWRESPGSIHTNQDPLDWDIGLAVAMNRYSADTRNTPNANTAYNNGFSQLNTLRNHVQSAVRNSTWGWTNTPSSRVNWNGNLSRRTIRERANYDVPNNRLSSSIIEVRGGSPENGLLIHVPADVAVVRYVRNSSGQWVHDWRGQVVNPSLAHIRNGQGFRIEVLEASQLVSDDGEDTELSLRVESILPTFDFFVFEPNQPGGRENCVMTEGAWNRCIQDVAFYVEGDPVTGRIPFVIEAPDPYEGGMRVSKTSEGAAHGFSVEGAIFAVYEDLADAQRSAREGRVGGGWGARWTVNSAGHGIVTHVTGNWNVMGSSFANGTARSVNLEMDNPSQTVWLVEIEAPEGHRRHTEPIPVVIQDGVWGTNNEIFVHNELERGAMQVRKQTDTPALIGTNSNYSLAGAEFALFTTRAAAEAAVGTNIHGNGSHAGSIVRWTTRADGFGLITHATGVADQSTIGDFNARLPVGAYYVVEIVAPAGHSRSLTVNRHEVSPGDIGNQNIVTVTNRALFDPPGMEILKVDADGNASRPQGDATLVGAEFTLRFFHNNDWSGAPALTLVYRTQETPNGADIAFNEPSDLVPGQTVPAPFLSPAGLIRFPLGSVTIEETRAPNGFVRDTNVYRGRVIEDSTNPRGVTFTWETVPDRDRITHSDADGFTISNEVIRGGDNR